VSLKPRAKGEPIDLKLTLHYAVCKDICVPAKAEIVRSLTDVSSPTREAATLAAFEAQVPREAVDGLRLERVALKHDAGTPALLVELAGPRADIASDIFVEGYDSAYFRAPRRGEAAGKAGYTLPIDALKDPEALKGRKLTLTIVAGDARLVREAVVE
jgi:DsbC/DsbD-like thiol-disulfide interchange protein